MSGSIGLSLYMLAAKRAAANAGTVPDLPVPPGMSARVWLHAARAGDVAPFAALANRLAEIDPGIGVILTHPEGNAPPEAILPSTCLCLPALHENPALLRRAFDLWQPGALVTGDLLLPALINEAAASGDVSILLLNGRSPVLSGSWRAWPGLTRALLRHMARILVCDETAAQLMRRSGAAISQVEVTGPLSDSPGALPCNMAERDAVARLLGSRPVWLAVNIPEHEEDFIIAAQRGAQRFAHRLLLILVPRDPSRGGALAARIRALGMRGALRSDEEEPGDDDQFLIADTEGELGLWYRLAPMVFMGGTTTAPECGRNPLEPAALGAAIIHGPHVGEHRPVYLRLAKARATRRVTSLEALTEAVNSLLAPDRAALMAQGAWQVATDGAEATDRALDLIRDALGRTNSAGWNSPDANGTRSGVS